MGCDLPALQSGHALGQRGLLDASCHPELLLYALALNPLLLDEPLHQFQGSRSLAPLLGDLASEYAVDDRAGHLDLFARRRDPP